MRFIQMWFVPSREDLNPSVEQRRVEKGDRTNRLLLLVSNEEGAGLRIFSDAKVFSCFLRKGAAVEHSLQNGWGGYLYVLEGGPVTLNGNSIESLGAAVITDEERLAIAAAGDSELVLVETAL
jgi:redox-sensitive bicupin YhaK (pirin superfamily)